MEQRLRYMQAQPLERVLLELTKGCNPTPYETARGSSDSGAASLLERLVPVQSAKTRLGVAASAGASSADWYARMGTPKTRCWISLRWQPLCWGRVRSARANGATFATDVSIGACACTRTQAVHLSVSVSIAATLLQRQEQKAGRAGKLCECPGVEKRRRQRSTE